MPYVVVMNGVTDAVRPPWERTGKTVLRWLTERFGLSSEAALKDLLKPQIVCVVRKYHLLGWIINERNHGSGIPSPPARTERGIAIPAGVLHDHTNRVVYTVLNRGQVLDQNNQEQNRWSEAIHHVTATTNTDVSTRSIRLDDTTVLLGWVRAPHDSSAFRRVYLLDMDHYLLFAETQRPASPPQLLVLLLILNGTTDVQATPWNQGDIINWLLSIFRLPDRTAMIYMMFPHLGSRSTCGGWRYHVLGWLFDLWMQRRQATRDMSIPKDLLPARIRGMEYVLDAVAAYHHQVGGPVKVHIPHATELCSRKETRSSYTDLLRAEILNVKGQTNHVHLNRNRSEDGTVTTDACLKTDRNLYHIIMSSLLRWAQDTGPALTPAIIVTCSELVHKRMPIDVWSFDQLQNSALRRYLFRTDLMLHHLRLHVPRPRPVGLDPLRRM